VYNQAMTETVLETCASHAGFMKRGRQLEYFTIGWNLFEACVAASSGLAAGSISLIGFGIDSLIESLSGVALIWRLRELLDNDKREKRALRLVGISFLVLAIYVGVGSGKALINREPPATSLIGICLAIASLIVMPVLARAKRRVAVKIDSRALHADSRQSDLCAYLSLILLAGLSLNASLGWWWADPVAGLLMIPLLVKEGVVAVRGANCGCGS
jgi:divalent metal cation (Fe/Co/Zn/Cd) transporter